jgi:hypothetical protein
MILGALALAGLLHCPDAFHLRWVAARESTFPPARFAAIAQVESGCNLNPRLRGALHEIGRFQITPGVARRRCPGTDVRVYRGNVSCALRILEENMWHLGLTDATRRYNGSGPASYLYLYHVLKREESGGGGA